MKYIDFQGMCCQQKNKCAWCFTRNNKLTKYDETIMNNGINK